MGACCGPDRTAGPSLSGGGGAIRRSELEALAAGAPRDLRMVGLAGGAFRMGSEDPAAYAADLEGPVRTVHVAPFAIAATTVTNAEFAVFVAATGYLTDAERHGDSLVFAGRLSERTRADSPRVVDAPWWCRVTGAHWFSPEGPGTSVEARADHPVTHVSHRDAEAYAAWAGCRLPTEPEWEFAARGGLDQEPFPWGSVREPGGVPRMNTFAGRFPDAPSAPVGTARASGFHPNAFGLHQMTGNVWEWSAGTFSDLDQRPVMRGGSYLCHDSYCRRYRTSARTAATADTSLGHTGFRLAVDTG